MFRYCSSLINLEIPESILSIGNYSFYNCNSLISIIFNEGPNKICINSFQYCSIWYRI